MHFETHPLQEPLAKYIESVFHFKDFIPDHSIERVVPTGHVFLIFELDGFVRNTFDNDTLEPNATYTNVWISGTHKNYISISAHENSEMFVIQFKPFGAHPFLHIPLEELAGKILPAEDLFGDEILDLREKLLSGNSSAEKFSYATSWLESRFREDLLPPEDLLDFYSLLAEKPANNGQTNGYPNSQKHLIAQFKKYVGLTPKYIQRILRFNEILQMIHQKQEITWAHIAYRCGFTDQSYFIKEFKHFSGFNPEEFIKNEFHEDETNFFPLDRG